MRLRSPNINGKESATGHLGEQVRLHQASFDTCRTRRFLGQLEIGCRRLCIPTNSIQGAPPANFALPNKWLESPTGGVCVEVLRCSPASSEVL